jgi:purine-cytosine permease-like protein
VTLLTGAVATLAGMFPGIAMKLLGFVMLYGMLLMPMGAVIFVDFYWMRKFRLRSEYALHSGTRFNWAAGLTWFITLAFCLVVVNLDMQGIMAFLEDHGLWTFGERSRAFFSQANQIYFVSLPGWFVAAGMYLILSRSYQRRQLDGAGLQATSSASSPSADPRPEEVAAGEQVVDRAHPWAAWRTPARVVAWLAILGIVLPPLAYLAGKAELDQVKIAMLIATLVWFVAAPLAAARPVRGES